MFKMHSIYLLLAAIFSLFKIVLYSKLVSIEEFGVLDLVFTVGAFAPYIIMIGLDQALARQLGRLIAKKQHHRISSLRNKVLTFTFLSSLLLSSIYLIIVSQWFSNDAVIRNFMIAVVPFSLGTIFTNLLLIEYRADLKFDTYSKLLCSRNFLTLLFGGGVAYWLGDILLITTAEFIANVFVFLHLFIARNNIRFNFKFDRYFKFLILKYIFFNISALLRSGSRFVDKAIVVFFLSLTDLGYYSFGLILATGGTILSGILSTYLEPKWVIEYKLNKDINTLLSFYLKLVSVAIVVAILLYIPFVYISNYIIINYFNKFIIVLDNLYLIYIATVFITINVFETFFLSTGQAKSHLLVSMINIAISFSIFGGIAMINPTLENFSIGFCVVSIISFFIGLVFSYKSN